MPWDENGIYYDDGSDSYGSQGNLGSGAGQTDWWNQQFINPNLTYNPFPGGTDSGYAGGYGGSYQGYYNPGDLPGGPPMQNTTNYNVNYPSASNPYPQSYLGQQPPDLTSQYGYPYNPNATQYGTGPNGEPIYNNPYTNGSYNPYTGQSGAYQGYNPYTGVDNGQSQPYSGTGGGYGNYSPNINITMPGGTDQGNQYNPYVDQQLNSQASMYNADQQYRAAMAATQQRQQAADQSYQQGMAQIASTQQYYQGLLQNAQLDQQTRQYIADQSNALGMYQANLQSQYQQGLLGVQQGQLGLGNNTLYQYQIPQMQGQLANQQYSNATQNLGTQGNLLLGAGNLALNAQQIQNNNAAQMGGLYLQGQLGAGQLALGQGNLGVSQQQADTQKLQALIAGYLGQGNLTLGQKTLDQTVNQANQQLAMQRAQMAASLQGPRNAFSQQAAIHGLNANGVSNAVDAISGQRVEPRYQAAQAPVEAANLSNFSQDTGLPIPGVNGAQP